MNTEPAINISYRLLKTAEAKKIGLRSTGKIHFQLLTNDARQHLWLRLSGNDSSGCFSTDLVDFATIESCVQDEQPIASKSLAGCFNGRSANNGPFLCAALRGLGLLVPTADNTGLSLKASDWQGWRTAILEIPGTAYVIPSNEKVAPGVQAHTTSDVTPIDKSEHTERTKPAEKAPKRGKLLTTEVTHASRSANA